MLVFLQHFGPIFVTEIEEDFRLFGFGTFCLIFVGQELKVPWKRQDVKLFLTAYKCYFFLVTSTGTFLCWWLAFVLFSPTTQLVIMKHYSSTTVMLLLLLPSLHISVYAELIISRSKPGFFSWGWPETLYYKSSLNCGKSECLIFDFKISCLISETKSHC